MGYWSTASGTEGLINNRHHAAANTSEARRYVKRAIRMLGTDNADLKAAIDLLDGVAEWILDNVEVGK